MKIALVSHEYPPFRGGGIGTYTTIMSALLAQAGHEVHVITNRFVLHSQDPLHRKAVHQEGNLWVHRIDALTDSWEPRPPHDADGTLGWHFYHTISPYFYYAECVADQLQQVHATHDLDVVEFPECAAEGYAAIRRKQCGLAFQDLPMTVTLHSPIWEIYHYNLYSKFNIGFQRRNALEEYTIRHADAINSPSTLLAKIVCQRLQLVEAQRLVDLIPLPMDFSTLPTPPTPTSVMDERPSLLFVGRLEPRKGVKFLVDAAVRVMVKYPHLNVYLIGQDCDAGEVPGKMSTFLRQRIPVHLQGNFHFMGLIPRAELFPWYSKASACVFAAPWDNFPLACCEAMASGACVIASDYSGMAEMIEDGHSGLLFRARDIDMLATQIERVLTDPALAATLRQHAIARIRHVCDPEAAVRNRIAHYTMTIERHRARRRYHATPTAPAMPTVAVFFPALGPPEALARSIASVRATAHHAGVRAQVSVVGTHQLPGGVLPAADLRLDYSGQASETSALQCWLRHLEGEPPTWMLPLWPGEELDPTWLHTTIAVLGRHNDIAWGATWSLPFLPSPYPPFCEQDFTLPLHLLDRSPVPQALIRYEAYRRVGGYNWELPPGWRAWDLRLAFAAAELRGLVIPLWLARYIPRADLACDMPLNPEARSLLLEAILTRHPRILAAHAPLLWAHLATNTASFEATPFVDMTHQQATWWALTKTVLKRRWPRLARVYHTASKQMRHT